MEKTFSSSPLNEIIEDKTFLKSHGHVKRYEKGKFLGKGAFAKCYEIKSLDTGKRYAAKIIPKSVLNNEKRKKQLLNEILIHKSISHRYILKFIRYFEDKDNVYLLTELCSGGCLSELLKTTTLFIDRVQKYIFQLLSALYYLHKKGILHRDIKIQNILLDENDNIKLCDFGFSIKIENISSANFAGTPNYIAPEVLTWTRNEEGQEKGSPFSYKTDIWAVGVVLYHLLTKKAPFDDGTVKRTYDKIKAVRYSIPRRINLHAKTLIRSILRKESDARPGIPKLLNHPFLRTSDPYTDVFPFRRIPSLTLIPSLLDEV